MESWIWYRLDGGIGMFCQNEPPVSAATRRPRWGRIEVVPKPPPESTKISLRQRLTQHAQARWPGLSAGSPEEALDCVCGLYLNDPTGWSLPPTN